MLSALTPEQEHMLLYAIKEVHTKMDSREQEALIEALAKDGSMLEKLLEMHQRV